MDSELCLTRKPPPELIDEIFAARPGKTEVVALSVPPRRTLKSLVGGALPSLAASAAALLAIALALTLGADRAMAGSSILTLNKTRNGAMELRYETVSPLAAELSLRARIRYWVPDSLRFVQTEPGFAEIELSRKDAGRFEGVAKLPPGTVYAVAAVENREGTFIDSDRGQFWEYLEKDAHGRPTVRARRHQLLATPGFNIARVAEVAERAASEFPDRPEFWFRALLFRRGAVPAASMDTFLQAHTVRLDLLDRAARRGHPGPVEVDALSRYASILDRPALVEYWSRELLARFPRHGLAALVRLGSIARSRVSNEQKLNALEESWTRGGAPATAQFGLEFSYRFADPALTRRWLDRQSAGSVFRTPLYDADVAEYMMEVPALWSVAEDWILDRLSDNRDWTDGERPLDQSRDNYEAEMRRGRARLELSLARIRLARGDLASARQAAERSIQQTWNPEFIAEVATIHDALGAERRVAQLLALARVDPVAPLETGVLGADGRPLPESTEAELDAARQTMQERIRSGLLDESVNVAARLRSASGDETTLGQVLHGGSRLVIQAIQLDVIPDEDFALLAEKAEELTSAGVETLLVSQQPDSSSTRGAATMPLYLDTGHEVWDALRAWRTVQYFVLDRRGRLRHRGDKLEDALRISLVLSW